MRTRTEEEMLALILGFAEADERIRAVVMNASRVTQTLLKTRSRRRLLGYLNEIFVRG